MKSIRLKGKTIFKYMKKKKGVENQQKLEFLYGKENAQKSMYQIVEHVHGETVAYCDFCNAPLTRSDINDYGTLCERCYMKEYYGDQEVY